MAEADDLHEGEQGAARGDDTSTTSGVGGRGSARGKEGNGKDDSRGTLSLVPVVAAAASGIGVLGFVTFAGGVVLWRRFSEMGLPGDDAVAVVPKSTLIATGADFLAPAFAFTALTVLVLVMFRAVFPTRSPVLWAVLFGGVVALANMYLAYEAKSEIGGPAFWLLLSVAAGGGVVVAISSYRLSSVSAVALISFIATGTFWVARAYDKTSHAPSVVPMAYSRHEPGGPASIGSGYLVAETSDRLWFASLPQSNTNELREFPRTETDDLELGQLTSIPKAQKRAALFVANLCHRLSILAVADLTARRVAKPSSTARPTSVTLGCSAFVGARVTGQAAVSSEPGIVTMQISCPKAAVGDCVAALTLRTRRRVNGRIRIVGAARLRMESGNNLAVRLKLNQEGRRLLRAGAFSVTAVAASRDATYHRATRSTNLTIGGS